MNRTLVVILLLVLLCGCAGSTSEGDSSGDLPVSVSSDKLPIDFQVDGEKCSFTHLSFLDDGDVVYIVAMIEAPAEVAGKLDTMRIDFNCGDWGHYGRKVFALGKRVFICSKFLKENLGDTMEYSFFILGDKEDGIIKYTTEVVLEPYEGYPSTVRMKDRGKKLNR